MGYFLPVAQRIHGTIVYVPAFTIKFKVNIQYMDCMGNISWLECPPFSNPEIYRLIQGPPFLSPTMLVDPGVRMGLQDDFS